MQLQKIRLTTLITLLAAVSTPVFLRAKSYALESRANNSQYQEIAQN